MNLKVLSSESMLSNSNEWLNNPELRRELEKHPLARAMLVELQSNHDGLSATVSARKLLVDALQRLTAELDLTDGLHDRSARGLGKLIAGLIEVSTDPQQIAQLIQARDTLFPEGMQFVQWSYSDEHGAVVEMESRLSPEVRSFLARTRVGETTLLAIYDQWVAAGMRLGELTKERARIRATMSRTGTVAASIDTVEARNAWVRATQVFLSILAMLPLEDDTRRALLAPLERDVALSLQSRARRGGAGEAGDEILDESGDELLDELSDDDGQDGAEGDDGLEAANVA